MAAGLAPACREDVSTVVSSPVVEGPLPPVKSYIDHFIVDGSNCSAAD